MTATNITADLGSGEWSEEAVGRRRSPMVRSILHDRMAVAGIALLVVVAGAAALASVLAPYDPNAVDVTTRLEGPTAAHPLGTDHLGRDVLSRVLHGGRTSLGASVAAAMAISMIGITLGLVAGYAGGVIDRLISSVIDMLLAFPSFLLALAVTGVIGPGLVNVTAAVVVVWWASYARIVRGAVLSEREQRYVEAARAVGATQARVMRRHILPNVVGPVVVLTTLDVGAILLGISALSFLGLGVAPPTAEWGAMLSDARSYLGPNPAGMVFPGLAIFLVALAFNLVGDGLRDALDPRVRGKS